MRLLLVTVTLLIAIAAPAAAAPTMKPLKPCYVAAGEASDQRERIHVVAFDFTPAARVNLLFDGQYYAQGHADIDGKVVANVPAPPQQFGQRPFTLTLQEIDNPDNFVTKTSLVAHLSVTLRPRRARPSRKVRFSGRGFTLAKPVFGHYLFGGKVRKTIKLSRRPAAPCGRFHAHRRQIPVHHPAVGDWTLQVDQQRHYSPHPESNVVPIFIRVRETFTTE